MNRSNLKAHLDSLVETVRQLAGKSGILPPLVG